MCDGMCTFTGRLSFDMVGLLELVRGEASVIYKLFKVFRCVANASTEPAIGRAYALRSPVGQRAFLEFEILSGLGLGEIILVGFRLVLYGHH